MQVRLDDSLDVSSTEILHELGLSGRCGGADARYEAQIKEDEARRETDRTQLQEQTQQDIKQQMEGFSTTLPIWLIQQVVPYFPYVYQSVSETASLFRILGHYLRKH